NTVRAWLSAATAGKQTKVMVAFMARAASKADVAKKLPAMKNAWTLTLSAMGRPAVEETAELLSRGDATLKEGAGRVAAMIGPSMVPVLVSLIAASNDITVRRTAAGALKEIGDGTRQLGAHVRPEGAPPTLRNVLSVFELAGPSEIGSVLKTAVQHPDQTVRDA